MEEFSQRAAVEEDDDEAIGEFQAVEYLVLLLAFDTFAAHVEEGTHAESAPEARHLRKGIRLLQQFDAQHAEQLEEFLRTKIERPQSQQSIKRTFLIRVSNLAQASRRALTLRTVLSRGGPQTLKAVFDESRARKAVRSAITAAMLEDPATAMAQYTAILLRNIVVRNWIKKSHDLIGSETVVQNPVEMAASSAADVSQKYRQSQVTEEGSTEVEEVQAEQATQQELLSSVQNDATAAARQALEVSGEEDLPPTKSEVVGIATATAMAVAAEDKKVPASLQRLDPEQRAAALTDGRVLVAAGAGAGKSSTLVARVEYLVKERGVLPSRILVTSFNNKAAIELKERLGKAIGTDALKQMSVGTMHSLFKKFITDYGTKQEQVTMSTGFVRDGSVIGYAVQKIWEDCYGKARPIPKLKNAQMAKSKWAGNRVSPEEARASARSSTEQDLALWYEMYEGLKGSIPGWKPVCYSKSHETFMARNRPNNIRLGDFSDMLSTFLAILQREPRVKEAVQKMYDHLIVDEAQDRNTVMTDVLDLCAEHVTDGADGKSYWVVGDDKQAINSFQGARSQLFVDLYDKEGWKTRTIRTNYRCEPELVDAANKLIAHNTNQIPMEAVPNPQKIRGIGSIQVVTPKNEADAALGTIETVKTSLALGGVVSDYAVLTRTNKEIHAYETACIIRGVPYARKGASSFLGSPETTALLGYVQLVTGSDFTKMQKALGNVINKPTRFFLADPKKAPDAIASVVSDYARYRKIDVKAVNPLEALQDPRFVRDLALALGKLTRTGKSFKFEEKISDLADALQEMVARTGDKDYATKDLFDDILGLKGTAIIGGSFVDQSFRESLQTDLKNRSGDDDADDDGEDDDDGTQGLGNISFLYQLAKPDPTDEDDMLNPPTSPLGFKAKMERYASRMKDLRTDTTQWYKEQANLPSEKQTPPPGVYLGTCHSTKGAQWPTTFVAMPANKFPLVPPVKPGEDPPPPEETEQQIEDERRLAYVAITRASKNLTIVCPSEVGGKPGGISPFVAEAGLRVGENVPKAVEVTKTAAYFLEDADGEARVEEIL